MIITIQQHYPDTSMRNFIKLVVKKLSFRYGSQKTVTNNTCKRSDKDSCTFSYYRIRKYIWHVKIRITPVDLEFYRKFPN